MLRGAARLLLWLGIALVAGEAILQIGARFAPSRDAGWRPGARYRILCVGDSHTYGVLVDASESYPARLQAFLDEQAPGQFSVVNLGIPGLNTAQLRERLPVQVDRYRPDVVIAWAGINDSWNHAGDEIAGAWRTRLDALASHSRLYRFARLFAHDVRLDRDLNTESGDPTRQKVDANGIGPGTTFTIRSGGRVEQLQHQHGEQRTFEEVETSVQHNDELLAVWTKDAGAALVLVTYPFQLSQFAAANRGIRAVGARYGVPVLDSPAVLGRVTQEERLPLWGGHPSAPIYREIAHDLVPIVLRTVRNPEAPEPGADAVRSGS